MIRKLFFIFLIAISASAKTGLAQTDDLSKLMDESTTKKSEPVIGTFKGKQLINFQTLETDGKHTLQFIIQHRFGDLSSGSYNFYGIDGPASIRLGLSYGITDRLELGIGRSSLEKEFDGHLKYRLLWQTANNGIPFSITLFAQMGLVTMKDPNATITGVDMYHYYTDRFNYVYQVMIGRKFTRAFSLQFSPTMIHYNIVELATDKNDIYAIVAMARLKFTKHTAVTGEYAYRLNNYSANMSQYHNSAGIGVDIETGGHVFQIQLTNSFGIDAEQAIPYTTGDVTKGNLKIGFNISRDFSL